MTRARRRKPAEPAKPRKVVDVSVDFDFFIREELRWDFGHSEHWGPGLAEFIWRTRYEHLDLHAETDPATHADFQPRATLDALFGKGMRLGRPSELGARRRTGLADSHEAALAYLTRRVEPADVLVSLDAHHDLYTGADQPLTCGNWLAHYIARRPETMIHVVGPGWKRYEYDLIPDPKIPQQPHICARWKEWVGKPEGEDWLIRDVFLCRSSAWVPPHHDPQFLELAALLGGLVGPVRFCDTMYERTAPTREEAAQLRSEWEAVKQKIMAGALAEPEGAPVGAPQDPICTEAGG